MKLAHDRRAHGEARPAWRPSSAWLWMLGLRRRDHQEIATVLGSLDATEGRIAELYPKAVGQAGRDQAPVRFGGLYTLERLGQDNPAHRQAIVNVICAYLRRPFSTTAPVRKREPEGAEGQKEPGIQNQAGPDGLGGTWQQEREVRLTAQRILTEHLRNDRAKDQRSTDPPGSRFWNDICLDLTGATLIDFNLVNAVMGDANFAGATFTGDARFAGATFTGDARFGGATFSRDARFGGATFTGDARFGGATFSRDAQFGEATFTGDARFGGATFSRDAQFSEATFTRDAGFRGAAFGGDARFGGAVFGRDASFSRATFTGRARFGGAAFGGVTGFVGAAFGGDAGFVAAAFGGDAWFHKAAFSRGASFDKAVFTGDAWFGKVTFGGDAGFDGAAFGRGVWFGEAAFGRGAWFGEAAFGGDVWFDNAAFGRSASFDEAAFGGDAGFDNATFTGGAWFGEATFSDGADALHFKQARILSPGATHVWPTGWRLADADGGGYTVVRANDGRQVRGG